MADYSRQITALHAAIASGVLSISIDGTSTGFDSFDQMIRRVNYLERLQARGSSPRRARNLMVPIDLRNVS